MAFRDGLPLHDGRRPIPIQVKLARYLAHDTETGCWPWAGYTVDGYGIVQSVTAGRKTQQQVHRAVYELLIGPIPPGYHLDHLCHNADPTCSGGATCRHRACANPAHLEAVTPSENSMRSVKRRWPAGTAPKRPPSLKRRQPRQPKPEKVPKPLSNHCKNGHPREGVHLYVRPDSGSRECRSCRTEQTQRRRAGAFIADRGGERRRQSWADVGDHTVSDEGPSEGQVA